MNSDLFVNMLVSNVVGAPDPGPQSARVVLLRCDLNMVGDGLLSRSGSLHPSLRPAPVMSADVALS